MKKIGSEVTVEIDFKGAGGDEMSLDGIGEEKCHQSGVKLVLQGPLEYGRCGHVQIGEWILTKEYESND